MSGEAFNRRNLLKLGGAAASVGVVAAACSSMAKGPAEGETVSDVNDLTLQQANMTTVAYNRVQKVPGCQYPANLLQDSLELRNLREKLLRYNQPNKLGYIHVFSYPGLIAVFPVMGKVSSTQSSMTSDVGVYQSYTNSSGSPGGGNVPVKLPTDDISWGPNEGGDQGVFFFTPEEVMVVIGGCHWIYCDTLLPGAQGLLVYKDTMRPSSTSKG